MSGIDLSSLSNLAGSLGSALPSGSAIMENVLVGAASSVVLKGLQAGGAQSLDPLGLFHAAGTTPAVAATNNPAVVSGPTITASAFASLPAASQGTFLAAGGHIVSG
jgi:hypothetical protein